jgi:hypothetical protein
MMCNTNFLKETIEFFIFTTPIISLNSHNFHVKVEVNVFLKVEKNLINFRTILEQIYPSEFTKIINESYII